MTHRRLRTSRILVLLGLAALAGGLAACGGGTGPTTPAGPLRTVALTPPATGCGSVVLPKAIDPDGVLAALPARYQKAYAGYATPVRRSLWANWKPKHGPPYTVGIQWAQLNNPFQLAVANTIKAKLEADPEIGKVTLQSTGSSVDIPQQIAQFTSLLRQRPDLIVVEPLIGDAFIPSVKAAAKAGIPTVAVQGDIQTPYSVNVQSNDYQASAQSGARAMRLIGGKGNVLVVHGIPSTATDDKAMAAFKAEMKLCPGVKAVGEIEGNFVGAQAKTETLKFLATHPQKIAAALPAAIMATGVMSGFQQAGRQMPVVDNIGPDRGALGYWLAHRTTYAGVGTGLGPESLGTTTASVVLRMLQGQGVQVTDVTNSLPVLSTANLDRWAQPGWTLATTGEASGPADGFANDAYLNPLFAHGAPPK